MHIRPCFFAPRVNDIDGYGAESSAVYWGLAVANHPLRNILRETADDTSGDYDEAFVGVGQPCFPEWRSNRRAGIDDGAAAIYHAIQEVYAWWP